MPGPFSLRLLSLLTAASLVGPALAEAQALRVAAASDLQPALPGLVERFERETGRRVLLTFGSSGNFFAQIQNGAPFDVFFSADVEYPRRLEVAGVAEPGSLYSYATGRLVLWVRQDSGLDVTRGLPLLLDPKVRRIAIANPEHAPYGRAAVGALQHAGVYERVRGKLVLGENISQTAQFVHSGNAEAGLIALSLARAPALRADGNHYEIPSAAHSRLDQAAVIVARSTHKDAARQLLAFLARPDIVGLIQEFGFGPPTVSAVR